ncbi:MAG TPA: ATP-binding SpoIIE family protein phosphatase [Bryobacteraceae bacterium]
MTKVFPVAETSRVAEVRRAATALCRNEGLNENLTASAALVATEICTNLLKHAKGGEVFLSTLSGHTGPGLELLAIDRGPGMADVDRCLADGYSSGQSPGTGLGAISRLSQAFDLYSEPEKGTVLVAQIRNDPSPVGEIGVVLKPISGEDVAGDLWAVSERERGPVVILADGLGHGLMAARAAAEAISAFRRSSETAPASILNRIHGSLRGTRGAAVAIASIDRDERTVRYSGLGNISGIIAQQDRPVAMVSHNGTAGYQSPRLQEFSYPLPEQALLVMHSDGLASSWNLDRHPGLRRRHPSVVAGVLYREAARQHDDACVVVIKLRPAL